ncbi:MULTISPECIES: hypothetical protein [Sphingomonas]|uniref:hypothetical protein n=1 Tax=Sphingomonas TaxID=13687 RepID=UPI000DEF4095|nr:MULTISPECIES: hypothetical protein [Sphingomonas]
MKHDALKPTQPSRRSWTRAEDYLPPRRLRRGTGGQALTAFPAQHGSDDGRKAERMMLGLVPFVLLMLGLGIMSVAIAVAAWPGRHVAQAAPVRTVAAKPATTTETTIQLAPR